MDNEYIDLYKINEKDKILIGCIQIQCCDSVHFYKYV